MLTYTPGGGRAYIHAWWWTCSHTRLVVNVLTYTPGGERAYIHAWWWTCSHTRLVVNVLTYTPGGERAYIHAWWWTCSHAPVDQTTHNMEGEQLCTSDEICSLNVQWALTLSCTDTTSKEKYLYLWSNYCTSCSLAVYSHPMQYNRWTLILHCIYTTSRINLWDISAFQRETCSLQHYLVNTSPELHRLPEHSLHPGLQSCV